MLQSVRELRIQYWSTFDFYGKFKKLVSKNAREVLWHYLENFKSCGEYILGDDFLAQIVFIPTHEYYVSFLTSIHYSLCFYFLTQTLKLH